MTAINRLSKIFFVLLTILIVFLPSIGMSEEKSENIIRVAVSEMPPLCYQGLDGEWQGFDIDLLRQVLKSTGEEKYEFVSKKGVAGKIKDITAGSVNMGICGMTHTLNRAQQMEAVPVMETGVRVLTRVKPWWSNFFQKNVLMIYATLVSLMFLFGVLFYFAERKHKESTIDTYGDGMFLAATTISTVGYGRLVPITLIGRILAFVAMLGGIPWFAAVSGTIWGNMSSSRGMMDFQQVHELSGYQVGVVADTANQVFLENNFITPIKFDSAKDLYDAMMDGKIDLAVHDEVSITAFAKGHSDKVIVVGPRMYIQNYVWYLPLGAHDLRKKLELALLKIQETGVMSKLRTKWLSQ